MRVIKVLKPYIIFIVVIFLLIIINSYGISEIKNNIDSYGIFAPLVIFLLRTTSIIIPALPGTAYSVIAGALFGLKKGYIIICIADILSCSISFYLSRKFGKRILYKITSSKIVTRIDRLSKKHLESNFWLMTGLLMTGFFDFVSYAIGLTNTNPNKFAIALIISVLLSNLPIVAFGAGLLSVSERKSILLVATIGILVLALISKKLKSFTI